MSSPPVTSRIWAPKSWGPPCSVCMPMAMIRTGKVGGGDNPPFGVPVFVLTHQPRPSIAMAGGTTFHFRDADPLEVLREATTAAGGKDVRIGGGATTARTYLQAGLVDELHVAIVPILLGRGVRLWDDFRGLVDDFHVVVVTSPSN